MNGWSWSPKHGPGHFTVLTTLFMWTVRSFSKKFEHMAGPCSPKHGSVLFTVLKNHFIWESCSYVKTFKFMAGPRSPTSSVTAQLIWRRWRIHLIWCWADFQQRSNERLVVLPRKRSRLFLPAWYEAFQKHSTLCLGCAPPSTASSFHGDEEPFRLNVMQPCKNIQVYGWAALPNIFCHGPAHFAALKTHFVLILCRHSTTFKWTDGRAPPNTVPLITRCW